MEALRSSGTKLFGIDVQYMRQYTPRAGSVLVTYGLGGHDRLPHALEHIRSGGHVVALDAGYWDRKTEDRRYRVSIDGFHCPNRIMRGPNPGPERWNGSGLSIQNRSHPRGDVILVGNSTKARAVGASGWTQRKSQELRKAFGLSRRVVYRPKNAQVEPGIICHGTNTTGKIEAVLDKASLVVCRHSNVAVDACRLGIPVVCEDGAAAAIYPSRIEDEAKQPSEETRREFLHRIAYWQWSESEIKKGEVWPWLIEQLQ